MANLRETILSRYEIDIDQENILKLYKISSPDISEKEMEDQISATRNRWQASINGPNEKNANRDRARLEKASKYEEILRASKYRKELFDYYDPTKGKRSGSSTNSSYGSTKFAREYFQLIATTKKLQKSDVDFFFKYYQSERKNKKAILEMLGNEFKQKGLGNNALYSDDKIDEEIEGKKKDESSPLITNLFQEATILKLRRAVEKFDESYNTPEICQYYPSIRNGLYDFLEIEDVAEIKELAKLMTEKGSKIYEVRQERGASFAPLVDFFNIMKSLVDYKDVVDNIQEFKLLIKYPNLTSYMYSFVAMKPATLKGIVDVANRDYVFRDQTDFILNFYEPVYDNFGINNSGISSLIRKAEKNAKKNKILDELDKKIGRKKKKSIPLYAEIIHWLVYWPIFMVYLIFEITKVLFTKLPLLTIPLTALYLFLSNWLIPKHYKVDNLFVLRKIFFKTQWIDYMKDVFSNSDNDLLIFIESLLQIIFLSTIYILPTVFVAIFLADFADDFNKRFDWIGIERTFKQVFMNLRAKTEEQFGLSHKLYVNKKIPKAIVNLASLALVILAVLKVPILYNSGFHANGIGINFESSFSKEGTMDTDVSEEETTEGQVGETMVITVNSANIRSGPGTDYGVVKTAGEGNEFIATGNEETGSNGRKWYEIYLDENMEETAWASEKVIEYK